MYGPDAKPARAQLRRIVAGLLDRLWPADGSRPAAMDSAEITELSAPLYKAVRELKPATEAERTLQTQALQIGTDLGRARWLLSHQDDESIPVPFLAVLGFWLFVLFVIFGLLSPRNVTVVMVLLVCALSVASALFLIADLGSPSQGLFQMPDTPLRKALSQLGQ